MFRIDFERVRPLFGGKLTQAQVDGINLIVNSYNKYGDGNKQHLAQDLGTTKWETAHTMQPIKETQRAGDKTPPTDQQVINRLNNAFAKGKLPWVKKPYWKDGWFGRGFVQLTHEFNYKGPAREAVLKEFGVDIYKNRDAVMVPEIAAFILVRGSDEGWFTGKALSAYIDDLDESDAEDLLEMIAARRVINGTDRAKEIAEFSLGFEGALEEVARGRPDIIVEEPEPELETALEPSKADTPVFEKKSLLQAIIDFFLNLLPKPERRN